MLKSPDEIAFDFVVGSGCAVRKTNENSQVAPGGIQVLDQGMFMETGGFSKPAFEEISGDCFFEIPFGNGVGDH